MANKDYPDALAFLESLKGVYQDVDSLLNTQQLKALDADINQPFEGRDANEDFLDIAESYFAIKVASESTRSSLRGDLMEPHKVSKQIDTQDQLRVIEALNKIASQLLTIWKKKLETTEKLKGEVGLPRIIKLSRKLKLSEKELMVLVYVMCAQVNRGNRESRRSSLGYMNLSGFGTTPFSVCRVCDMKIREVIDFLNQDRTHMQQGLFPDVQQTYLLQSTMTFDEVSLRALVGADLKASEFLKLEQTCLADVIVEESGNEHLRIEDVSISFDGKQPPLAAGPPPSDNKVGEDVKKVVIVSPKHLKEGEEVGEELGTEEQPNVPEEEDVDSEIKTEEEEDEEKAMDLDELLRRERMREKEEKMEAPGKASADDDKDSDKLTAYKTDLEYLDDNFQLIAQKIKVKSMDSRMEMEAQLDDEMRDTRTLRQKREAQSKAKVLAQKCEKRLTLTKQSGTWVPRLERMVSSRGLVPFEKNVLLTLIGFVIQPNKILPYEAGMGYGYAGSGPFSVGEVLRLFCSDLHDQIKHRKYFYKLSTLVREGMIIVHNSGLNGDPTAAKVEIDRRMLDFCVGLDTEFSEIVEGSHLYYPKTLFSQVVLSKEQKSLILSTVSNFEAYKKCRKRMGMDDAITYGAGMVILFHGDPGTGKTMMANALANKLGKKVLLINFPSLGSMTAGENFKFIFREAKINDAILFFDECEAIFETREKGSHDVNMLLTEIERHDGLIIMATNRPYDLDEAMHRRIMIAVEFRQPDHLLRKAIWQSHIPETMKLGEDVDLDSLSLRFELSGGFIKNAILSALSIAVSRDGENPTISQSDILQGANLQLRGRLRMKDFHRRLVPSKGLDKVIVSDNIMKSLKEIVQYEKARSVLFGQWGFSATEQQGLTCLFHGYPGTGKSLAAEAVGYEVGKPLKVVNCGELLSKWVGESTKNIDAIFQEARSTDAILVFDEAEGLFGQRTDMSSSTDRYANVDVGVLLYHIERFQGIIILTTNIIENMDKALFRRLKFVLPFDMPSAKLRARLWKLLIPTETPLGDGVDFDRLSRHELTGGNIKNCIFRAAARAALRPSDNRILNMDDLEEAALEEIGKSSTQTSFRRQDSDTIGMYN